MIAQSEMDVIKYVQTDINGTARYMGMAGAFGALGGDASAIKDNPAGLGIYRKSELVGSMSIMLQNSTSNWKDMKGNDSYGYGDMYKTGFNNFSLVFASPILHNENQSTGLLSSNWSFGYNRLKDFNRTMNIKSGASSSSLTDFMGYFTRNIPYADLKYTSSYEPFSNNNVPWLSVLAFEGGLMKEFVNPSNQTDHWESFLNGSETVTPSYFLTEKGYLDEYSIGWAGNFSNMLYLGATANLQSINYTSTSTYSELFGSGGGFDLKNTIISKGTGVNLNVGAILRPTDFLRFGLAFHTPTIYAMNDQYSATLNYDTDIKSSISTPTDGVNEFQLQGPMQVNASAALVVGKKGIISAEYDFSNYTGTRLMNKDGNAEDYTAENNGMKDMLNDVTTIKIGGEYKLTDNFSLRAGYANMSVATKAEAQKYMVKNTIRTDTEYFLHNGTNYITAGFGYREASWFIDFALMHKILDEHYMSFNSNLLNPEYAVTPASVSTVTNNLVVTLGLKF
ncbi:MAG: outer membrane protein transport protein [Paludibacter sp.]